MNMGFFYGRNGVDALNIGLTVLLVISGVVSIFVRGWVLAVVQLVLLALFLLRFFSRNLPRRRKENELFLKVFGPLIRLFSAKKQQYADPAHKYFKCPKCSARLRVPKGRGRITVTCPKCKNRFEKKS